MKTCISRHIIITGYFLFFYFKLDKRSLQKILPKQVFVFIIFRFVPIMSYRENRYERINVFGKSQLCVLFQMRICLVFFFTMDFKTLNLFIYKRTRHIFCLHLTFKDNHVANATHMHTHVQTHVLAIKQYILSHDTFHCGHIIINTKHATIVKRVEIVHATLSFTAQTHRLSKDPFT